MGAIRANYPPPTRTHVNCEADGLMVRNQLNAPG